MAESTDIHNSARVNERASGKLATTNVTNELARAINTQGAPIRQGVDPRQPPWLDRRFYLVWDQGPNGEPDLTNHVYWIREAYIVNPAADAITEPLKLQEIPVTDPKGEGRWFPATNLSERPKNVGGTEANGSHALPKGTPIFDVESIIDPKGIMRHFFRAGGPIRMKITGNRTRGIVYKANFWGPPATTTFDPNASGAMTAAQLGVQGDEVHFINLAEVGANTHDLGINTIVWGTPSILRSSVVGDTKPVYEGYAVNSEDCT